MGHSAYILQAVYMHDGPPSLLPWGYHRIWPVQCTIPLLTPGGPNLSPTIWPQIEVHQIPNLGLQDIINVLLDNWIPPLGWIILTCLGLPIWMPIMLGTAPTRPYIMRLITSSLLIYTYTGPLLPLQTGMAGTPPLRVILPDYILSCIWLKTIHPLPATVALPWTIDWD